VCKHGALGKLLKRWRLPISLTKEVLSFIRCRLVTEGARVKQVGVELPKRAVVWVVMWWLTEPKHPLGCVSSAHAPFH
jgi:hypothetical protein